MASTSSQIASSSSSSSPSIPPSKHYDVFLSFRGDTRLNFTDHLFHKLTKKGIYTFRDEEKLGRGKSIKPELLKAIEESTFAIVILSREYASSTWCLEELAKIVERKEGKGLTVLPIFYHVEPTHVRNQEETFADAFAEHEKNEKIEKVQLQTWRDALKKVANLSGWDIKNRHEAEVIEEIVKKILGTLNRSLSSDFECFVGIDSRVKEMMDSYLGIDQLDDVRFIGICGMGGIGKTTLAQAIYQRISDQFEAHTFLSNVREEVGKHGLVHLQKELLCDTLCMESSIRIPNDKMGSNMIKNRLCHKKVLIILDDVDKSEQLKALAKERGWFGQGSRIVITTRDERVLSENELVEGEIYKAKELDNDEALILLSQKAFKEDHPPKNYLEMSKEVLNYANGLPLALEVLGSSLFRRSEDYWRSTLIKLKKNPNKKILDTLKISFDGLDDFDKNIFLDIACFFKGYDRDHVESILESCEYYPEIGIEHLIEKSLITISRRKLWMHDLLEELGREIVRRDSPEEPGKRTRLWCPKDACNILTGKKGTEVIEGIFLNLPQPKEVQLDAKAFSKMTKLRLLRIYNVNLPRGLNYLSNKLRVIHWYGYPSKSLPINFQPSELVDLSICSSCIEQLHEGILSSDKLILIDLSDSQNLIKTPDFTKVPKLKSLILKGCTRLYEVHPSIGFLKQLTLLNLEDCKCLNYLPDKISLKSLEVFILSGCSRLEKFPEIEENMTNLSKLYLDRTAIKELPLSFKCLSGLVLLSLRDCKNLSSLSSVTCSLTSLRTLTLSGCSNLDKMPEDLGNMKCLEELDASKTALRHIPPSILLLKNLKQLSFHGCKGLPPKPWHWLLFCCLLPSETLGPISLSLPDSFLGLRSLESLNLSDCNLLDEVISNDLNGLSSLKSLDLSENNFTSLPESIFQLSELKELSLRNCSKLRSLPKLPPSLLYVWARGCTSLETHSDKFVLWASNDTGLTIIDCSASDQHDDMNISLPGQRQLLQRRLKADIYHTNVFYIPSSVQTKIPKWFNIPTIGSSTTIPLNAKNVKWVGYAMFVVYEVHKQDKLNLEEGHKFVVCVEADDDPTIRTGQEFVFRFESDKGPLKQPLVLHSTRIANVGPTAGLWVYVPRAWFSRNSDNVDEWRSIEASIVKEYRGGEQDVEVKMLGVRLLYEQEASEFVEDIFRLSFGKSYGIHSRYYELKKFRLNLPSSVGEEEECSSMDSTSTSIELKRHLQSLLSRCYEVKYARNKIYKYIFPRSVLAEPPWFSYHTTNMVEIIYLPQNLYDNDDWIGFAVYAYFSVHKHPTVSGDYPTFYCHLCAGNDCIQPLILFPITKDIFDESHRFLVFHVPRAFFTSKLNQWSSIEVEFGINNICPDVKVETCGIRVVYEKDLEGYVETIVDCILKSPDVYHQGYYQSIKDQVDSLPSYVHEAESSENTFDDEQRSESWKKFIEHIAGPILAEGTKSNVIQDELGVFDKSNRYIGCFPRCGIPEWFFHCHGPSMKIEVPPDLNTNNSGWEGIALCASLKILKHPSLILDNLGSKLSHHVLNCFLGSHVVIQVDITEALFEKSIWLNQREFIWISYLPRDELKKGNITEALFGSESQDIMVQNCGYRLVNQQNREEFVETIKQCSTTFHEKSQLTHQFVADDSSTSNKQSHDNEGETSETDGSKIREIIHGETRPGIIFSRYGSILKCMSFLQKHNKEIDPLFTYNNCFPPSFHPNGILEWFSCRSNEPSVTIELPQNMHEDLNWAGFALCASFSVQEYSAEFLNNLEAEIPHRLICHFETDIAGVKPRHVYRTTKEELKWSRLGGFIWLSYIPYRCLSDRMNKCNRIEASIVSYWPGFTVQKCGLHLVYHQDGPQLWRIMNQCSVSFLDNWAHFRSDIEQNEIEECSSTDPTILLKRKFENVLLRQYEGSQNDFQEYIFPQRGIPSWFSHRSFGPSAEIQLPPNLYNDERWMGFVICAVFGSHANLDSTISHAFILHLHSNEGCLEPDLPIVLPKNFFEGSPTLLVLHISHKTLPHMLNQWSFIQAVLTSNIPGVVAEMCGIRILYKQDFEGFFHTMADCLLAFPEANRYGYYQGMENRVNNLERSGCLRFLPKLTRSEPNSSRQSTTPIYQGQSSGTGISIENHDLLVENPFIGRQISKLQDFNLQSVYNLCFPPSKVVEWFKHHSNEPLVRIPLPTASENDRNWMGLALCASFSIHDQHPKTIFDNLYSKTARHLFCHLENSVGSVHFYCPTMDDLMLLNLGGIMWLSYIPRGSLPEYWLNQCNQIEASISSDFPNLTAEECGFRLVYQRDKVEFNHTIRHCMASFSDICMFRFLDFINQLRVENNKKLFHDNFEAALSRPASSSTDQSKVENTKKVVHDIFEAALSRHIASSSTDQSKVENTKKLVHDIFEAALSRLASSSTDQSKVENTKKLVHDIFEASLSRTASSSTDQDSHHERVPEDPKLKDKGKQVLEE